MSFEAGWKIAARESLAPLLSRNDLYAIARGNACVGPGFSTNHFFVQGNRNTAYRIGVQPGRTNNVRQQGTVLHVNGVTVNGDGIRAVLVHLA